MAGNTKTKYPEAQNPLILRCHRLMEAFAKSDDERDFYLDRIEGFIVYADLDKTIEELEALQKEIESSPDRFCLIPKLSFFETKKIMEGFVHEKVYDIDTKEKLLDIIQSKEARENFLEFIYDHHTELEKWQQFYQERSRIRIIEWLRNFHFHFVFEEDLDLAKKVIEGLKENLFEKSVPKDVAAARKLLASKAKTYYSNEALNPRPKRGRPPKQQQKLEVELQVTSDIYTTVPKSLRPFLFTPEITSALDVTFSSKFESREELLAHRRASLLADVEDDMDDINQKLASLRKLSSGWKDAEEAINHAPQQHVESAESEVEEAPAPTKLRRTTKKEPAKQEEKSPVAPKKRPIKKLAPKKTVAKKKSTKKAEKTPEKRGRTTKKKMLRRTTPKKGKS